MDNQPPTNPTPPAPEAPVPPAQPVAPPPAPAAPAPGGEQKEFTVALILSILVGGLGIDRFYLGYVGLGILKLITAGGCGIWYIVDIILIAMDKLPDSKGQPLKH